MSDGFSVMDEIEIPSMSDVRADDQLLPPATGVLGRITNATIRTNKAGTMKWLSLQLRLPEGIEVNGETKYVGKVVFADACVWVDTNVYTSDRYTSKTMPYLNDLKLLRKALGEDTDAATKINDEYLISLKGRELRFNIIQRSKSVKTPEGKWEKTADLENKFLGWKAA